MKVDEANGSYRTCDASQLQQLTQQGWSLVHIEQEQAWVAYVPDYRTHYDSSHAKALPPPAVITRPLFVLAIHRDRELEDARAQRAKDEVRAHKHAEDFAVMKHGLVEAQKATAAADAQLFAAVEQATCSAKEAERCRERVRRMEADLAAVRKEVGEREWARILAPKAPA